MTALPDSRGNLRRINGDRAEQFVAEYVAARGWSVLARNVQVGRDEIDLVAVEPSDPPTLVFIEVRSHTTGQFGSPEEGVRARKVANLYRAARRLVFRGRLPDGAPLPPYPWRIDLIAVDEFPAIGEGAGGPRIRHLRGVAPD